LKDIRKVVAKENVYDVIQTVHNDVLNHSGYLNTYATVSTTLCN